ncbi:hypothetical protein AWJ20_1209 [Sugiyamaella lignohabitans]|uniref:BTB domain-containing protein n=1 Tax=Sugiyamaella lignohabitans TaxID=796027 RepID=A0A167DHL8_9ASCO|nr:uncharacterized protein AWJ20_1209 [Sugiyamaella lignohabitans]ANB12931.1 hypothetical protein AWJ20_1209 [Sugiyamaella lignohabitans]
MTEGPGLSVAFRKYLQEKALGEGFCSDITIHAFGKDYALHKFVLYRSSYFVTLSSDLWNNDNGCTTPSAEKCNPVYNIELGSNFTQEIFELALGQLYGINVKPMELKKMFSLLELASFLDIPDLSEECSKHLIQAIDETTVHEIAILVCSFEFVQAVKDVRQACEMFLCIESTDLADEIWLKIPCDMLVRVTTSDSFFIKNEWERCQFLIKLYRKVSKLLIEIRKNYTEISRDAIEDPQETASRENNNRDEESATCTIVYEDSVEEKVRNLDKMLKTIQEGLNSGIHYMHMTPTELSTLWDEADHFGEPLIHPECLQEGLWDLTRLQAMISQLNDDSPPSLGLIEMHNPGEVVKRALYSVNTEEVRRYPSHNPGSNTTEWTRYPPMRIGVELPGLFELTECQGVYTKPFFYAGSAWAIFVWRSSNKSSPPELSLYRRIQSKAITSTSKSVSWDSFITIKTTHIRWDEEVEQNMPTLDLHERYLDERRKTSLYVKIKALSNTRYDFSKFKLQPHSSRNWNVKKLQGLQEYPAFNKKGSTRFVLSLCVS